MDMTSLIYTIVEPLVSEPDDIEITMEENDEFYEYFLSVNPEDIGRVIGKKGRIAKAMRTILYSIKVPGPKRVRLTIKDN